MNKLLPAALLLVLSSGCHNQPVVTVYESPRSALFNRGSSNYVENRTQELQRMGGPFKDEDVARQKAEAELSGLFGAPTVVYSSVSDQKSPQAELNESLDQMNRDKGR